MKDPCTEKISKFWSTCCIVGLASLFLVQADPIWATQVHGAQKHGAKAVLLSPKDQEIARLQAEVKQLQASLALAQAKIDSIETAPVAAQSGGTTNQNADPNISFSDIRLQSFPDGDSNGDPLWVVTFLVKNADKLDIPLPVVYLNCTDNNIGSAKPYSGRLGLTVVNPSIIHPGQQMHLKYGWVSTSPNEQPSTITVSLAGTNIVQHITLNTSNP